MSLIDQVFRASQALRLLATISLAFLSIIALTEDVQYAVIRAIYNVYFHPLSRIPGPRAWSATRLPYIRSLLRGTIVHDFQNLHTEYGPVLRVAPNEVIFAQEEAWPDIFLPRPDTQQQFLKDPTWWKAQPGWSQSLISAIDPTEHAHIRKHLTPAFTPRALGPQEPMLHRYVNLLVERLRDIVASSGEGNVEETEVDIGPWFNFTTFNILLEIWAMASPSTMQKKHFDQIADKVNRRLNWELERPDIMSYVIRGRKGEKGLDIGVLNATFSVLTTTGSETTATVLTGTLNYLVNDPENLAILAREIRQRFESQDKITLDALRELKYLHACLSEGLRLCVPTPNSFEFPGQTPVSIQAYTMNRRPEYFHDAASFRPERWLPEASSNPGSPFYDDHRQGFRPFSTGPRDCLGQHLAWAEMRLIMAKLVWNFDFKSVPGKLLRWEDLRTFLFVEKKPVFVNVRLRR
ncbi:hypothetical protein VPNG_09856 [Cytospora leucostoma]|uniref:Cytochrome P450 n=1 Tax=Cytospora leucostoma TaxID=1230097 RepID=A0A423VIQ7_9PEZI|nr:hypothetical protein VPNG_09856 [Cytospora leucostoma]